MENYFDGVPKCQIQNSFVFILIKTGNSSKCPHILNNKKKMIFVQFIQPNHDACYTYATYNLQDHNDH